MTALNDVLTTEKESELAIENARDAAAKVVVSAKAEHVSAIEAETEKLHAAEAVAVAEFEKDLQKKTAQLEADAQKKVAAVKSAFEAKKADVTKDIKQRIG